MGYAVENERPELVARMLQYPEYFTKIHDLTTAIILGQEKLIDAMLSSATFTSAWLASRGRDKHKRYPLVEAIWKNDFKTALRLVEMEVAHNVKWDYSEISPLAVACASHHELRINRCGANRLYEPSSEKIKSMTRSRWQGPISHQLVEVLLDAGHDVNTPPGAAIHPLHIAVAANDEHIVRLLIKRGTDVNFSLQEGYTPLAVAIRNGSMKFIELLTAHGADWPFRTAAGSNALHLANDVTVAKLALKAGVPLEGIRTIRPTRIAYPLRHTAPITPLMRACERGKADVAMYLIEQGARIDVLNKNGFNILHSASCSGMVDFVRLAHARGVDVNAKDWKSGYTPLHRAVSVQEDVAMAETLLLLGADVEIRDSIGRTPIHLAHSEDAVRLLMRHGANINSRDSLSGKTALHSLASAYWADKKNEIELLIELGASLAALDDQGNTPLHLASSQGRPEAVRALLAAGADVNPPDSKGNTPLHLAAQQCAAEKVRILLAAGADITKPNADGYPPLLLACFQVEKEASIETVRVLLDAGADVTIKVPPRFPSCKRHRHTVSAIHIASTMRVSSYCDPDVKVRVLRMLLEAGADINCCERFFDDQTREQLKETLFKLGITLSGYTITAGENGELVVRSTSADVVVNQPHVCR